MKKLYFLLPLVIIVAAGCTLGGSPGVSNITPANNSITSAGNETLNTGSGNVAEATTTATATMKLADSPYADSAYLISSDLLSADAQKALTGFTLSKQVQSDGSTLISLTATNPEYTNQKYMIQPGQSLYFVDRTLGDDFGVESNQGDDFGLITNADGYIVPTVLPLQ